MLGIDSFNVHYALRQLEGVADGFTFKYLSNANMVEVIYESNRSNSSTLVDVARCKTIAEICYTVVVHASALKRGVSSCRGWGQPRRWGYVL